MGLTVTQLAYAFGGSNPSLPTKKVQKYFLNLFCLYHLPSFKKSLSYISAEETFPCN